MKNQLKKLKDAATKQNRDFKQLQPEREVFEKVVRKVQEQIDKFTKQNNKKVLKQAEAQSASVAEGVNTDRKQIKQLLEELWMCTSSKTKKSWNQEDKYILPSIP